MVLLLGWKGVPATGVTTQWAAQANLLEILEEAPSKRDSLAALIVPSAVAQHTGSEGVNVVGGDIRLNIESLPTAL